MKYTWKVGSVSAVFILLASAWLYAQSNESTEKVSVEPGSESIEPSSFACIPVEIWYSPWSSWRNVGSPKYSWSGYSCKKKQKQERTRTKYVKVRCCRTSDPPGCFSNIYTYPKKQTKTVTTSVSVSRSTETTSRREGLYICYYKRTKYTSSCGTKYSSWRSTGCIRA